MTLVSLVRKTLAVAVPLVVLPLIAAPKERIVRPLTEVTVTGVITDSATGQPVAGAQVINGTIHSPVTDSSGTYSIKLPEGRATTLTAQHFAYTAVTRNVTPTAGARVDFTLAPLPAVTVKLTSGETRVLDLASSQFAYLVVFSGYVRSDNANFCRQNGTAWTPAKTDFARIIGPGRSVSNSACCTLGPVISVDVVMKSGETASVNFADSCFGNEVDFLGRERSTGVFLYFRMTDIAEIDFP